MHNTSHTCQQQVVVAPMKLAYHNLPTPSKHTTIKETVVTDIDKIWQRYVDYNDHSKIFDYNNEYQNSQIIVKSKDISNLKDAVLQKESVDYKTTKDFLMCNETLSCSDKEDENAVIQNEPILFDDSDDSVKDKDYVPDSDATDTDKEDFIMAYRKNVSLQHLIPRTCKIIKIYQLKTEFQLSYFLILL